MSIALSMMATVWPRSHSLCLSFRLPAWQNSIELLLHHPRSPKSVPPCPSDRPTPFHTHQASVPWSCVELTRWQSENLNTSLVQTWSTSSTCQMYRDRWRPLMPLSNPLKSSMCVCVMTRGHGSFEGYRMVTAETKVDSQLILVNQTIQVFFRTFNEIQTKEKVFCNIMLVLLSHPITPA